MPIEISELEDRIHLHRYTGNISIEEIEAAEAQIDETVNTLGKKITVILDLSTMGNVPVQLHKFISITGELMKNTERVFIVGLPTSVSAILSALKSLKPSLRKDIVVSESIDSAIKSARSLLVEDDAKE